MAGIAIFSGESCFYNDPGTLQNGLFFFSFHSKNKNNASDGIAASSVALFCLKHFTVIAFVTRSLYFAALWLRVAA